jgi:undecaprenyl-diphosphatase
MSFIDAIILGIIQGLTEFLPVSSSGHLELAKFILGDQSVPEESLMFTVVVHAATALSTLVIYRKDVAQLIKGLFAFAWNDETKFVTFVVISMIPAAFVGLFFEDEIESLFGGQILLVGAMLVITGLLLMLADRAKKTQKGVKGKDAFIIGIAQAIAILPGISRSGATISTSVLLGIDREKSARFSFLMVVPLILGKMILSIKDMAETGSGVSSDQTGIYIAGFATAFIAGLIACKWMISLVKKAKLTTFAIYCFVVGAIAIGYTLL